MGLCRIRVTTMLTRNQLSTIILLGAVAWGVLLWAEGVQLNVNFIRPITMVIGFLTSALAAFNLWFWKWSIFRGWLVKRPVIEGTWKVELRSRWKDPTTGQQPDAIEGFMAIRQTYAGLSMRLMTKESSSVLLGAELVASSDGVFCVAGVYRNEPIMAVRDRSQMHHGALLLEVFGSPATAMRGTYWTDRDSTGDIELTSRRKKVHEDYRSAIA